MPIGHSEQASHLRAVLGIVRTRRHNRGCCCEAVETRLVFSVLPLGVTKARRSRGCHVPYLRRGGGGLRSRQTQIMRKRWL
jgi:hypothetical protein